MKKLLNILATLGLSTTVATSTVACNSSSAHKEEKMNISTGVTVKDLKTVVDTTKTFGDLNTDKAITNAVAKAISEATKLTIIEGTDFVLTNDKKPNDKQSAGAVKFTVTAKGTQIDGSFTFTDTLTTTKINISTGVTVKDLKTVVDTTKTFGYLNTDKAITNAVAKAISETTKLTIVEGTDFVLTNDKTKTDNQTEGKIIFTVTAKGSQITGSFTFENTIINKIYDSAEDAIKSLNLTSYWIVTKNATAGNIKGLINNISLDAGLKLIETKYKSGVSFDWMKLNLNKTKVFVTNTKNVLTTDDLAKDQTLNLKITFNYDNKDIEINSAKLIITTKTDQQIVDYINNYDFSKAFISLKEELDTAEIGIKTLEFMQEFPQNFINILGSFAIFVEPLFINNQFSIDSIKNGNNDLKDEDFKQLGDINLNITYSLNKIKNQNLNVTISIGKLNFNHLVKKNYDDQNITLPDISKTSISKSAKSTIINAIKLEVQKELEYFYGSVKGIDITPNDYDIIGLENTVKEGADFSTEQTIHFTVTAKSTSTYFTGTLKYNTIKITVNNAIN